ncbi:MAG: hypothetical protein GF353_14005 [Candidatus Lokiarchaeota archaeon]|nr:hypothetical protein [Candidatus Lokiarchaeota archaeon]
MNIKLINRLKLFRSYQIVDNIGVIFSGKYKDIIKLTEDTFRDLEFTQIPKSVLKELRKIRCYCIGEENFVNVLNFIIEEKNTTKYKDLILEHTYSPKSLKEALSIIRHEKKCEIRDPLILKISRILYTLEKYLADAKKENFINKNQIFENVLIYLSDNLPNRGLLLFVNELSKLSYNPIDYIYKFEKTLNRIYDEFCRPLKSLKSKKNQLLIKQNKKKLLKLWHDSNLNLDEILKRELVKLILDDGDTDIYWIQYCIPYLSDKELSTNISNQYLKTLQKFAKAEFEDLEVQQNSFESIEKYTLKSIINTQLALLNQDKFAWAFLNIARLAISRDQQDKFAEIQADKTSIDNFFDWSDEYLDWNIEQAVNAGVPLTEIDLYIAAYAQCLKKNYQKVIELLANYDSITEEKLIVKCKLLLAKAHGQLWLINEKHGDGEQAIKIILEIKSDSQTKNLLTDSDGFLLCQLLIKIGKIDDAKQEFRDINLSFVREAKEKIAQLAWQLETFDKLEVFLDSELNKTPDSISLLSLQCALNRSFKNKFKEANSIIEQIRKLQPTHPWIYIKDCMAFLDQNEIEQCKEKMNKIPDDTFWQEEIIILKSRIELQKGEYSKAARTITKIKLKDRIDYQYWNAVINVHQNKLTLALTKLDKIQQDEFFNDPVALFRGKLYLAKGDFGKALNIFMNLPSNLEINLLKAWCFFKLTDYNRALELLKDNKTSEGQYLKAEIYYLTGKRDDAYINFKSFISETSADDLYLSQAVERFTKLVIEKEKIQDVEWLLTEKRFLKVIPNRHLAHLYAIRKDWKMVVEHLTDQKDERYKNNLLYAYNQILFNSIKNKEWAVANNIIEKLNQLNIQVDDYKQYLLRSELLDNIQKMEQKLDYRKFEVVGDENIQIAIGIHKFINGKIKFDKILSQLDKWAKNNKNNPQANLLMLIMHLIDNNKEKVIEYANILETMLDQIEYENDKLICQSFIAFGLDNKPIPIDSILQIFASLNQNLPISAESFWNRLVICLAKQNIEKAVETVDSIKMKVALEQDNIALVYAQSALKNLEKGQEKMAIHDLEKIIGD